MKRIVYIGHKELKGDNVSATPTSPGTGLVWTRGQVHEIQDEKKAALLLAHPLVWADATGKSEAEVAAMLLPLPQLVASKPPVVEVIPAGDAYAESFKMTVDAEVLRKLHAGQLLAVFMSEADADAFASWKKLDAETAPKATGPKAQIKGLEAKK